MPGWTVKRSESSSEYWQFVLIYSHALQLLIGRKQKTVFSSIIF